MRSAVKRYLSNAGKEVEKALRLHDNNTYTYGRLLGISQQIEELKHEFETQNINEEKK